MENNKAIISEIKEITSEIVDEIKFSVNSGNKHTGYFVCIETTVKKDPDYYDIPYTIYSIQPHELRKIAEVFTKAADEIEAYRAEDKRKNDSGEHKS